MALKINKETHRYKDIKHTGGKTVWSSRGKFELVIQIQDQFRRHDGGNQKSKEREES